MTKDKLCDENDQWGTVNMGADEMVATYFHCSDCHEVQQEPT